MSNDELKKLHTAIVDAIAGYREAVEDTDDAQAKAVFQEMIDLHGAAHEEIHRRLVEKGEKADDSGSFMSTVHKTVISVRAAVTGLGSNAFSSFASGEERIVGQYGDALEEQAGDPSTAELLRRQRGALEGAIARMKAHAE